MRPGEQMSAERSVVLHLSADQLGLLLNTCAVGMALVCNEKEAVEFWTRSFTVGCIAVGHERSTAFFQGARPTAGVNGL